MEKQIILNYEEYLEMEEKLRVAVELLSTIYFKENTISENIKNKIQDANRIYGWWI